LATEITKQQPLHLTWYFYWVLNFGNSSSLRK